MASEPRVRIRGMRELQRAFANAPAQTRRELRSKFAEAAVPVQHDAAGLARSRIRNIGKKWPEMRIGVTRTLVYVAPKMRGVKSRESPRRRPNLAELLMGRSMEPALRQNEGEIEHAAERALDRLAHDFDRGRF